jgi:hypothetical protein
MSSFARPCIYIASHGARDAIAFGSERTIPFIEVSPIYSTSGVNSLWQKTVIIHSMRQGGASKQR